MGACSINFTLPGISTAEDIKKAFKSQQENDRLQNGHSHGYSGDFQTVKKVVITDKIFNNHDEAFKYCLDVATKWENVIAVKYKNAQAKPTKELERLMSLVTELQSKLSALMSNFDAELSDKLKKHEFINCNECKARFGSKFVTTKVCPVCKSLLLPKNKRDKLIKLQAKIEDAKVKERAHRKELHDKIAPTNNNTEWLIAGWGAC